VSCVLCAVSCVLCAVSCVLCAVCCVLCAVSCVLCVVCCELCAVCPAATWCSDGTRNTQNTHTDQHSCASNTQSSTVSIHLPCVLYCFVLQPTNAQSVSQHSLLVQFTLPHVSTVLCRHQTVTYLLLAQLHKFLYCSC